MKTTAALLTELADLAGPDGEIRIRTGLRSGSYEIQALTVIAGERYGVGQMFGEQVRDLDRTLESMIHHLIGQIRDGQK